VSIGARSSWPRALLATMTEGERWTLELLGELRAAHYTPRAWRRFLRRSLRRAAERRAERPDLHREVRRLALAGLLPWAGVAIAGRPRLAAAAAGWWGVVALMLDWHLGMVERPDGRALPSLGAANLVTLGRAALVPALPALPRRCFAAAAGAAAASDALDGALARRSNQETRLGRWLDGAVDAVFLGVGAVAAGRRGWLPPWAVALVVARCALPWPLVAALYFARGAPPPEARGARPRLPGGLVWAGLVAAGLGRRAAGPLAALGALAGLVALGTRAADAAKTYPGLRLTTSTRSPSGSRR